ncbi:MAG: HEAT repeat domain-containing protein [Cyclobacteriaceae bacterium]
MNEFSKVNLVIWAIILCIGGCGGEKFETTHNLLTLSSTISQTPGTGLQEFDYEAFSHLKVPPLSPVQALEKFKLEEGFRIEVVAHEPMVVDPIAMDIDVDGRLWVIDMPSYMPAHDLDVLETSTLEKVPEARVVVLEDTDKDGKMDLHRIFYTGLILPRAIKVLTDGVLVAEPPNVWYIKDTDGDGKGDAKESVYNGYGDHTDPNIHSYPGGLMWGMDNWLHSSNNNVESIRKVNGEWKTMPFRRLGQWGMSQDNWGRLYSSNNSRPLQTHLVPYGYSDRHPQFEMTSGKNVSIGGDTLWPSHPTGVNRGYREGVLREDGTLIRATAVSSTVIYRGDQFGDEYVGNAFSPEPGANLVKRYIVEGDPGEIEVKARYAYEGKEFLTSNDERFRPINIYNSPDGTLYILDMYRGILEHASHLTDYLRNHAVERDLQIPTGTFGRIYRVIREDRPLSYEVPQFSRMQPEEWVGYLGHKNGLLRDQAQQVLVQCSVPKLIPALESLVQDDTHEPYTRLQALWTLEGYQRSVYSSDKLSRMVKLALEDGHPRVRAAAIRILEPTIASNYTDVQEQLIKVAENDASAYVQLQLLASLGESKDEGSLELMAKILNERIDSPYFQEMALTGVYNRETQLSGILKKQFDWQPDGGGPQSQMLEKLAMAQEMKNELDLSHLTTGQMALFKNGEQEFKTCGACHGMEGKGLDGVGPRLDGSEWVKSDPEAVVRIILQGFAGASAERSENITGVMPGHSYLSDKEIASVLTFIRQSWGNKATPIEPEKVSQIREVTREKSDTWTPEELRKILNNQL